MEAAQLLSLVVAVSVMTLMDNVKSVLIFAAIFLGRGIVCALTRL